MDYKMPIKAPDGVDLDSLVNDVSVLTDYCVQWLDEQSEERELALEYSNGEMSDMKPKSGRSAVVSQDIRTAKKKIMPSIMALLFSSDGVVEYMPQNPTENQHAEDATSYVNLKVVPDTDIERQIHDAISDAMEIKTGILKWESYKKQKVTIQTYTNQPDQQVIGLIGDPKNEISDHEITPETDQEVLAMYPEATRHSFKLKRLDEEVCSTLRAIPRGNFLIYPGAESIEESIATGERTEYTRAALVELGYDKDKVWEISPYNDNTGEEDDKRSREGDDWAGDYNYRSPSLENDQIRRALETVLLYEMYVRLDLDGDGIAEMYKVCYAEGGGRSGMGKDGTQGSTRRILLSMEQCEEAPYAEVVIDRDAHQFEGHSLAEDIIQYQRIKTVLTRNLLDNIYWQNNAQPIVKTKYIKNPEAVTNPAFGQAIQVDSAMPPGETPIEWREVPLFAQHAMPMLEMIDQNIRDETGITDSSAGMDPEAFQNTSATAAHLASESGAAISRMIVRWISSGLEKAFAGLLREVIANADDEKFIRINNEWQRFDPRMWDSGMGVKINTGLGTGTRERDMQALTVIFSLQEKIFSALGPDNMLVEPHQFYNTLEKIVEAAGLPNAAPYFSEPDPEEVARRLQMQQNQPTPEQEKLQAQGQLEQAKMQGNMQLEQAKMQLDMEKSKAQIEIQRDKERAQMEADLIVEEKRLQAKAQEAIVTANATAEAQAREHQLEREKIASKEAIEIRKLEQEAALRLVEIQAGRDQAIDAQSAPDPHLEQGAMAAQRMEAIMLQLRDVLAIAGAPRRIVRDEMDEIVGSEPVIGAPDDGVIN